MVQQRPHIVHLHAADIWRGAEQQLVYLYENLPSKDFQQTLFCMDCSPLHEYAKSHDWAVESYSKRTGANIGLSIRLIQFCKHHKVDLFHIHDAHSLNAWLAAWMLGLKVPAVLHRRVDFATGGNVFNRYKYNHPGIKKIICVSNQVKSVMQSAIRDHEKLVVLYDAVDLKRFSQTPANNLLEYRYPASKGKKKVATIAALVDHKDVPTFVKVAEHILKEKLRADLHFFIIGDGTLRQHLERMVIAKRLQDKVSFTGFLQDMPSILHSLDVYVFTSRSEAFGSTILEAMSAGLPVVATKTGAGKEILTDGKDALLADVGDYLLLAEHVLHLLDHIELKNDLVKNAFETAQSFSVERHVQEMAAIYLSCLEHDE